MEGAPLPHIPGTVNPKNIVVEINSSFSQRFVLVSLFPYYQYTVVAVMQKQSFTIPSVQSPAVPRKWARFERDGRVPDMTCQGARTHRVE